MFRAMCRAKIHHAVVSEADREYVGSITIPSDLCDSLDLLHGEKVDVLNVDNGARVSTYVLRGDKPKWFCINGAAAHHFSPGDRILVLAYCLLPEAEARVSELVVAVLNRDNEVVKLDRQPASPPVTAHS